MIEPLHLTAVRTGDDLELTIRDTTDKLIVQNWFHGESAEYQVEQIRFGKVRPTRDAIVERLEP